MTVAVFDALTVMGDVSRALANTDPLRALDELHRVFPQGEAGRILVGLVDTEPDWQRRVAERLELSPPLDGPGRLISNQIAVAGDQLTCREVLVLRAIAWGDSNDDAARRLGIAAETVKMHLKRVAVKLETPNRLAAVMAALRVGAFGPHDPPPTRDEWVAVS